MSGFEIAGILLGSIPLVISALEHYQDVRSAIDRYRDYESKVNKESVHVKTQYKFFIETLQKLLSGIVKTEEVVKFLENGDASQKLWGTKMVKSRLKHRLGVDFELYIQNMKGMEDSLTAISSRLSSYRDKKPQSNSPYSLKAIREWTKLAFRKTKFSLSKSEFAEQLQDLKEFNENLRRLTENCLKRTQTTTLPRPSYETLRDFSGSMFDALKSSLCCACDDHSVKLRLESRPCHDEVDELLEGTLFHVDAEELLEEAPFRVIFNSNPPTPAGSTSLHWKEADIKLLRQELPQVQSDVPANQIQPSEQPIHDLCEKVTGTPLSPSPDSCTGYVKDRSNRKYGIYPLESSGPGVSSSSEWVAYTLHQALGPQPNHSPPLTPLDACSIAVDLVSGILQLYHTPWLGESWHYADVYFVHRPGTKPTSIYQQTFVHRKFRSTGANPFDNMAAPVHPTVRNQTLYKLGLLLIELLHGETIERLQKEEDRDCKDTPGPAWCTATRLIRSMTRLRVAPLYVSAVRRCIWGDFNDPTNDLNDSKFQQAVFDGVLVPLQKHLRAMQDEQRSN